jgi:hypothetical protein
VLRALVFGDADLDSALAAGQATVTGAAADIRQFIAAFQRPPLAGPGQSQDGGRR